MCIDYNYILVVDDHIGVRRFLFEFLSGEGYNVEMATDGFDAITKVKNRLPSLILLDVKMPEMDGLQTLSEVKRIIPKTPVIMITAYSELKIVEEAKEKGQIEFYIKKPFNLLELRELIEKILHGNNSVKKKEAVNN